MTHPKIPASNPLVPRCVLMAITALLLAGCGGLLRAPAPKTAWLLMPDSAQTQLGAEPKSAKFAIVLAPVSANPLLLSDEIWTLSSDHTLSAQSGARWALAPDQMTQSSLLAALADSQRYTAVLSQPQQNVPAHQLALNLLAFWADASTPIASAQISWDAQLRCQSNAVSSTRITQTQSFELPTQMHESMRIAFLRALQQTQNWLAEQEQTLCTRPRIAIDGNTRQ